MNRMLRNLEKHQKYKNAYRPNDFFWGLGVEHETYLETSKLKQITLKELKENRNAERYSVNYYNIYTKDSLYEALDGLFAEDEKILIPILVNSHTFQKTDINGEHQTTYERIPKSNPKFTGKTIFDWLIEENPDVFKENYEKSYIFDGDTIEFMTQNFYKTTVNNVIEELTLVEKEIIKAINSVPREGLFKTYAPFQIAKRNYPFASYLTNLKHNAMFNNGTIHINITLPTKLNDKSEIDDFEIFTKQHQNLARVFQWISPLLVAKYGAFDPLCESKNNGGKYAAGSQRLAVSRYIGLGTYDTNTMPAGKILTVKKDTLENIDWYESFHSYSDYKFLENIGLDINFNKHFCHGLEFRIFESLPIQDVKDILTLIVHLADFSLEYAIDNPKLSKLWHKIAENCVHNGRGYYMEVSDQNDLYSIFKLSYLSKEPLSSVEVLEIISNAIIEKYKDGKCVNYMIKGIEPPTESIIEKATETVNEIKEVVTNSIAISTEKTIEETIIDINNIVPIINRKKIWCC